MRLHKHAAEQENTDQDHADVDKRLEEHERQLADMAKRLRRLELEAGIYKPPLLRGVGN